MRCHSCEPTLHRRFTKIPILLIRRGETKDPPADFFELYEANFRRLFENKDNVRNAIRQAFIEIEPAMDVHPSLVDRLSALGFDDDETQSKFLQAIMDNQSLAIQSLGVEGAYLAQKTKRAICLRRKRKLERAV